MRHFNPTQPILGYDARAPPPILKRQHSKKKRLPSLADDLSTQAILISLPSPDTSRIDCALNLRIAERSRAYEKWFRMQRQRESQITTQQRNAKALQPQLRSLRNLSL